MSGLSAKHAGICGASLTGTVGIAKPARSILTSTTFFGRGQVNTTQTATATATLYYPLPRITSKPYCTPSSPIQLTHNHNFTMNSQFGSGLGNEDPKTMIMRQVQQESAMQNARALVEKLNEHCFDRCVPKPGTSLSKGEEGCMSACMEKYMSAWNTVSKQYVGQITKQAQENTLQL
ncbi:hypothetical protein IAQ61_007121 [Plenodomus lingam]|nr:hypothetical protein IAQ61_007121 [Plenodomus lingam]